MMICPTSPQASSTTSSASTPLLKPIWQKLRAYNAERYEAMRIELRPYFQAHTFVVPTNRPLRQVLQKPETSGRLVKWAIELRKLDIHYHPRPAEKGQAVADFIFKLTPLLEEQTRPEQLSAPSNSLLTDGAFDLKSPLWTLYVDGSKADLVLIEPNQTTIKYIIRFQFTTSNNETEYKTLLSGLWLAKEMRAKQL
ncbi:unnamed protein product [Prunus brigantina]